MLKRGGKEHSKVCTIHQKERDTTGMCARLQRVKIGGWKIKVRMMGEGEERGENGIANCARYITKGVAHVVGIM